MSSLFRKEFEDGEFKGERGDRRIANALGGGEECEHRRVRNERPPRSFILLGEFFKRRKFVRAELQHE